MNTWIPFAIAFVVVAGLTPLVRRLALRLDFVDLPSRRRFHSRPVPLGGGLALLAGLVVAGLWLGVAGIDTGRLGALAAKPVGMTRELLGLVGGLVLVGVGGLVDDLRGMHPAVKFGWQVIAALLLVVIGDPVGVTGPVLKLLAIGWVVGLMNACNFLDNMDGILAGIAGVCAIGFWTLGGGGAAQPFVGLAAAVAGAALGFLVHNSPPARIFMGDVGSMALGYLLAAISLGLLGTGLETPSVARLIGVVLILGYPLFDITFVTIMRIAGGRKWYIGGKDHSTHRLHSLVRNPRRTALIVYLLTALVAAVGVAIGLEPPMPVVTGLAVTVAFGLVVFGVRLARVPGT